MNDAWLVNPGAASRSFEGASGRRTSGSQRPRPPRRRRSGAAPSGQVRGSSTFGARWSQVPNRRFRWLDVSSFEASSREAVSADSKRSVPCADAKLRLDDRSAERARRRGTDRASAGSGGRARRPRAAHSRGCPSRRRDHRAPPRQRGTAGHLLAEGRARAVGRTAASSAARSRAAAGRFVSAKRTRVATTPSLAHSRPRFARSSRTRAQRSRARPPWRPNTAAGP
jgi:hypothetical protein